jgi:lipopolysaccharide biosynthesis protein
MENRGRDIRPFLTLVEQGILDGYDAVCKIHGKKSLHGVNRNPYGEFGRRRMIFDLLCGNQAMARALRRFDVSPTLGLLGPEYFRVAGTGTLRFFWRKNRQRVAEVLRLFGISADDVKPDFFAGSMFWVRPKCLLEFKQLGLSTQFGDERGNTDGTLEHAIERSLTNIVLHAGYEIDVIDGLATR